MSKITRIAYNSSGWIRPTGDAKKEEAAGSYNSDNGFGHEEWLFRSEWQIDGWRYAFLQGVNKSRARLLREEQAFDVTLYTIEPDKRRRYVADIYGVECLDSTQAADAVKAFREMGWYDTMRQEIRAVGGKDAMLGNSPQASDILNVRFRADRVVLFPPGTYAAPDDPINRITRYLLSEKSTVFRARPTSARGGRAGRDEADDFFQFQRSSVAPVICTPEHRRMQAILLEQLRTEAPGARIVCEEDYVDVLLETKDSLTLFEIKTDLVAQYVIRQAIGQLLEYAYRRPRRNKRIQLVIVGRSSLSREDQAYLTTLRDEFGLPLAYRVVPLSTPGQGADA